MEQYINIIKSNNQKKKKMWYTKTINKYCTYKNKSIK